uniref:Uncharacterized protein n=1 Tax=Arundo donax TaxID=35708 RepID=A0A0A9FFV3_ARUDO
MLQQIKLCITFSGTAENETHITTRHSSFKLQLSYFLKLYSVL